MMWPHFDTSLQVLVIISFEREINVNPNNQAYKQGMKKQREADTERSLNTH